MFEQIEVIHEAGFLHLDIKPDNILVESNDYSSTKSSQLHIIDYGLSEPYIRNNGKHIEFR